jgi:hypothetical protein
MDMDPDLRIPALSLPPDTPKDSDSHSHQQSSANSSDESSSDESDTEPPTKKPCQCPRNFITLLTKLQTANQSHQRINIFVTGMGYGIDRVCYSHLRTFAKKTLNLLNSSGGINRNTLTSRLQQILPHSDTLDDFRNKEPTWFERSSRNITAAELREPFKYDPTPHPPFQFNPTTVLQRVAGPTASKRWETDGSLIVPNLLPYINDPEIKEMIDLEFAMYDHHFEPHSTRPKMGFLRNMFHSLTQQLVRQDIAWYCLNVALRPSHDWRQISYPYVAKMVTPGETTGFAHTDINIDRFIKHGYGANQLTSSVSLDHETVTDCTQIVPGFHLKVKDWHQSLENRNSLPTGVTTNATKLYSPEDEATWGSLVSQVCNPGDVRITRPEVIHGSTPKASICRRVIYNWLTSIQDDHKTLEMDGQLTWDEVAACHRDMLPPTRGVAGDAVSFSCPRSRFAGSVYMTSSSALCDALIGRRRWDDPQVLRERDIVLGDDDQAASDYMQKTYALLIKNFKLGFIEMVEQEKSEFGSDSFFQQRFPDRQFK